MKTSLYYFFALIFTLTLSPNLNAQLQRNPVLEYCTGTWCGYCPCGHDIIRNSVTHSIPNTIVIGYHGPANGSDPYSTFSGNAVISQLGFSSYPTGIVDRTSAPISRGSWYNAVYNRSLVNATIDIDIEKTFNSTTRELNLTINGTALANLNGDFKVNVVLTEDGLIASQTGYTSSGCYGATNYRHEHVVRSMLNGALGELMNSGEKWDLGVVNQKVYNFTIPVNVNPDSSHLVVFIYKVGTTLNQSNIQQAKQWTLVGNIVPVELTAFTAAVENKKIILSWQTATEKNNHGFVVERSADGSTFSAIGFLNGKGTTVERQVYSFIDTPEENGIFYYRLKQQDFDGNYNYSEIISVKIEMPVEFNLSQNYPNPFNPYTTISFDIPSETFVTLSIYDLMGREVVNLVRELKTAGNHEVNFDATNLASGTYIYKISAGSYIQSRKLMVLK
jgi:hypothetical protein